MATRLNPGSTRESTLKCDDECLRLQRNRKLAEALDIDPETHTDDHIPYSDTTLKLFRENINWAQTQEREFRVFADSDDKRFRFKPMQSRQRAFLHALAEDFGLDSESEDPEPHRHVCLYKTPRFVSAPRKTLAQCLRIAQAAANLTSATSSLRRTASAGVRQQQQQQQRERDIQLFNALVFKDPRFGLTIDELEQALTSDLAISSRSGPALTFSTTFLPSDEIIIKATPNLSAAAVATASSSPTPQTIESVLWTLKPAVARTISRLGLARAVSLCHADASLAITRKEGDGSGPGGAGLKDASGWSAVASRGSWRRANPANSAQQTATSTGGEQRAPSAFVALRRLELKKKEAQKEREEEEKKEKEATGEEQVEEDWLTAAEKLGEGEAGEGEREGEGGVDKDEDESKGQEGASEEVDGGVEKGDEDKGPEGGVVKDSY